MAQRAVKDNCAAMNRTRLRALGALVLWTPLVVAGCAASSSVAAPATPEAPSIAAYPPMANDAPPGASARAIAAATAIGRGVNFGNMLEAPSEGAWGISVTDDFIDKAASAGFASVRLRVRWSNHAGVEAPFTIDPAFMTRVESIVDKLLAKNLVVVLNMHHYRQLDGDALDAGEARVADAVVDVRYVMLWEQIAAHFRNKGDRLVLELYNEPHGRMNGEPWNVLAARALGVVRKVDPNYNPFTFTHQGAEWVSPVLPLGVSCCSAAQIADMTGPLDVAKTWATAKRYPMYVGEFGAYNKADEASRITFNRTMRDAMESRGMTWAYWEFAAGFGVYDPATLTFRQGLLDSLLER